LLHYILSPKILRYFQNPTTSRETLPSKLVFNKFKEMS
jgi:hypothetical protein